LLALCGLLVLATVVQASPDGVDSTSVGRAKAANSPFWVMMRSVAVPGWGQAKNDQWVKAVLLGGTETAFIVGAIREDRLAGEDRESAHENPDDAWYYNDQAEAHKSRKRDYVWWGAFTLLLSMGDAYVDAHLKGFDAEFKVEDSAMMLSVGVRW